MKYKTILADPPWTFRCRPSEGGVPYPTLSTKQLIAMGPQIQNFAAPKAHLYLWSTDSHVGEAFQVIEAWGFRYIQIITWFKDRMGLGFHFRHFTEPLLFAVRGNLRLFRRDLPSYFVEHSTQHSRKPQAAYRLMEVASPSPRLELFARERRDGWDSWGDEVASDICLDVPACGEGETR